MGKRIGWILTLVVSLLCACGSEPEYLGFGVDGGAEDKGGLSTNPFVKGLDISAVSIYQSVKIPLMEDGLIVESKEIPVIQGKEAMLRIMVRPTESWIPREVTARVDFNSELTKAAPLEQIKMIDRESSEPTLETSFNIDIPSNYLAGDLEMQISLREVTQQELDVTGSKDGALWPKEGAIALGEIEVVGSLDILFVPVRYNADGSGRLPDTTDKQMELYREAFYAGYPAAEVNITVGEPFDWDQSLGAMGNGWAQLLNRMQKYRNEVGLEKTEYLYAAFSPANNFASFCGMGCIAGLSNLAMSPSAAWARVSLGIGFTGADSVSTMVHEVGHAHGREHAPCGLGGQPSDSGYPYPGGQIGTWGYDLANKKLKDAVNQKDFMSYCRPIWVSDYTYKGLLERIQAVGALPRVLNPFGGTRIWRSVSIDFDGSLRMGPELEIDLTPGGKEREIVLLDGNGQVMETVRGYFSPYSHLGGGLVLFDEPIDNVHSIGVEGFGRIPFGSFSI